MCPKRVEENWLTRMLLVLCLLMLTVSCGSASDDDDIIGDDDAMPDGDDTSGDDDATSAGDDDQTDETITPTPADHTTPTPEDVTQTPIDDSYDIPVQQDAPWARFRRSSRNNGRSPVLPDSRDGVLWEFPTGKGIFHSPVIDRQGNVYIGSADTNFYAINPDGSERWRFTTGAILDSTALLYEDGTIYVPAGDGYLYALDQNGEELWRLEAIGDEGFITWWEGHISVRHDGVLLAGNDDRMMYSIDPDGSVSWTFPTNDQIWSSAAVGPDDEAYFGSNDMFFRSVSAGGEERWSQPTLGPVASSPAISNDGSFVVVGSFDGYVHAYDTDTGRELWTFAARDHFYSSPALGVDGTVYIGSADGTLYAIRRNGTLRWAYDTLDPIRSSPAIDGSGNIYFGCGDGGLYALNPDGSRSWSFDTTVSDRNDLNGSPAIGFDGIVIGGEAGVVTHVPFHYCEDAADDSRCNLSPGEDIPEDGVFLYYFTSGGTSVDVMEVPVTPMEVLTFRLVVREAGDTVHARIAQGSLQVTFTPSFEHRIEVAANGQFFSVIPETGMSSDQSYSLSVTGDYLVGGLRVGNKITGGRIGGSFRSTIPFSTMAPTAQPFPLSQDEDSVSVLLLHRLAVPQPPMLATFDQIGFDSYNYLMSFVKTDSDSGRFTMLTVEGTPGMNPTADPNTRSVFVLNGSSDGSFFAMGGSGFTLEVTGVSIVLDLFRVAGLLSPEQTADDLDIYAEVTCSNVEFFGPVLDLLGLCHPETGKMIVNGTAMIQPHGGQEGTRPGGITVESVMANTSIEGWLGGGYVEARFAPNTLLATEELPIILLMDQESGLAEELSYGTSLEKLADENGYLTGVRLHLLQGYDLTRKNAMILLNMFPLETFSLQ